MDKSSLPVKSDQGTEAIKETGQTLREIIKRLSGQPILLFGIAAMLLAALEGLPLA